MSELLLYVSQCISMFLSPAEIFSQQMAHRMTDTKAGDRWLTFGSACAERTLEFAATIDKHHEWTHVRLTPVTSNWSHLAEVNDRQRQLQCTTLYVTLFVINNIMYWCSKFFKSWPNCWRQFDVTTRAALQIRDRSPKSRPVASLNQSQTQLTWPVLECNEPQTT